MLCWCVISASALSRTVPVLASLVSAAACELFTSDIARQFGANYNRVSHVTCREGPGGWDRDRGPRSWQWICRGGWGNSMCTLHERVFLFAGWQQSLIDSPFSPCHSCLSSCQTKRQLYVDLLYIGISSLTQTFFRSLSLSPVLLSWETWRFLVRKFIVWFSGWDYHFTFLWLMGILFRIPFFCACSPDFSVGASLPRVCMFAYADNH